MSDEKSSTVSIIEAHEEFIQHIEKGSSRIRSLSAVTMVVSAVLLVSYLYQLVLPYVSGTSSVTVNLGDPLLQATEVLLVLLSLLWLYVGASDYLFTRKMTKEIKEARALEKELERRITG